MIYAGQNSYPQTTTLPDPNQPARSSDLGVLGRDLADRATFQLVRMAAHAEAQNPIELECTDGLNITLSPIRGVVSFDTMPRYMDVPTPTLITNANIEGALAPVGSAVYYLYATWALSGMPPVGAPTFELSRTQPDQYKLYKSTGTSHALLGIVQTDASAKWIKMRAGRHRIRYLEPAQIRAPSSSALPSDVPLPSWIPPECRGVVLTVNAQTNISVSSALKPYAALGPKGTDPTRFRQLLLPTGLAFGRETAPVEVPLGANRQITIQTDSSTSTIELFLEGIWW